MGLFIRGCLDLLVGLFPKSLLVAFGLVLAAAPAAPADEPAPDAARLRRHVTFLAADELRGRNAGQPGCVEAAKYLARQFEDLGLEAIGDDGTYFQRFRFGVRGANGEAETVNVVGLLPGTDPNLSAEVIVVGGHYDHVGQEGEPDSGQLGSASEADRIWNGADDNASGTAVVLEVARVLKTGSARPSRSVVFVLFGAEEQGLLGSRHYVSKPLVPLGRTVAMINLDMVGRNPEAPVAVSGIGSAVDGLLSGLLDAAQRRDPALRLNRVGITLPGGSDHLPFALSRVPALFVSTGLHADYHRVSDHVDLLSFPNMARIGGLVVELVRGLGTGRRASFSLSQANPFPTLGRFALRELGAPPFLGVVGMRAVDSSVQVTRVARWSRGAAAGLRQGDRIDRVNGEPLGTNPIEGLRKAIHKADRFATTRLGVIRDGTLLELIVVWRG